MDRDGTGKRTEKRRQNEDDPMDCSSKRTRRQTPGECSSNIAPICAPMASSVCPPGTSAPPEERQQLRGRRRQGALNLERQLVEQGDTFGREFMRDPTIRSPPSSPPRPPPSNIPGMQSPQSSPGGQADIIRSQASGQIQEICNQFMDDRFDPLAMHHRRTPRYTTPSPMMRTPFAVQNIIPPSTFRQQTEIARISSRPPPNLYDYAPSRGSPSIGLHSRPQSSTPTELSSYIDEDDYLDLNSPCSDGAVLDRRDYMMNYFSQQARQPEFQSRHQRRGQTQLLSPQTGHSSEDDDVPVRACRPYKANRRRRSTMIYQPQSGSSSGPESAEHSLRMGETSPDLEWAL